MDALTTWTLTKRMEILKKSLTAITQECCEQYWTSPGGSTPQSSSCTATNYPSRKLSKLDEPDMRDTVEEVRMDTWAIYSRGPLHMDEQKQDDQLEPIYNSSVPIQDIALKIYRDQWTIETGGKEGQGDPCWRRDIMIMRVYFMSQHIKKIFILYSSHCRPRIRRVLL